MTFQSTPPRGWRLRSSSGNPVQSQFQSTPPRGWRRSTASGLVIYENDFNPLHREGGDITSVNGGVDYIISIHSTARVETQRTLSHSRTNYIFQSTPPRGWRRPYLDAGGGDAGISIHSTARVETWRHRTSFRYPGNFNPLHREGGDRTWQGKVWSYRISIHSTARVETWRLFYA